MSTKHTASTLDQLIKEADIQETDDRQDRFYCERLKEFEASEVYRAHADLLIKLIDHYGNCCLQKRNTTPTQKASHFHDKTMQRLKEYEVS